MKRYRSPVPDGRYEAELKSAYLKRGIEVKNRSADNVGPNAKSAYLFSQRNHFGLRESQSATQCSNQQAAFRMMA